VEAGRRCRGGGRLKKGLRDWGIFAVVSQLPTKSGHLLLLFSQYRVLKSRTHVLIVYLKKSTSHREGCHHQYRDVQWRESRVEVVSHRTY
jgi:hypothetical protein